MITDCICLLACFATPPAPRVDHTINGNEIMMNYHAQCVCVCRTQNLFMQFMQSAFTTSTTAAAAQKTHWECQGKNEASDVSCLQLNTLNDNEMKTCNSAFLSLLIVSAFNIIHFEKFGMREWNHFFFWRYISQLFICCIFNKFTNSILLFTFRCSISIQIMIFDFHSTSRSFDMKFDTKQILFCLL
jgi:hypothetical protein